jgi:hypothetical protein
MNDMVSQWLVCHEPTSRRKQTTADEQKTLETPQLANDKYL